MWKQRTPGKQKHTASQNEEEKDRYKAENAISEKLNNRLDFFWKRGIFDTIPGLTANFFNTFHFDCKISFRKLEINANTSVCVCVCVCTEAIIKEAIESS